MLKVNEFEQGFDTPASVRRDNLIFDGKANQHFVYHDIDKLLNDNKGRKSLRDMIEIFLTYQRPRLEILDAYSRGNNETILSGGRRVDERKSDYRVRHNLAGYISDFVTSYVISQPVSISTKNQTDKTDEIEAIDWENDVVTLNYELGYDASRFGRAFELLFRDSSNVDRVVIISPLEMFVIRDDTVERNIIAAVHIPVIDGKISMSVYTKDNCITYKPFSSSSIRLIEEKRVPHLYNDVPVVEWWNNRFRQGDFEAVLPLIDAYDAAQSDTANYMSDLNDATLVLKGDLEGAGLNGEAIVKMEDANILLLQSGEIDGKQTDVSADYIYKQYDVTGTEAYKERLLNDIYKLAKVPNLTDDSFKTTSSGIALMYKMIGLEQNRAFKVSFFTRALRRRYELIDNLRRQVNQPSLEAQDLIFTFHPNIPQDVWAEIKAVIEAGGYVSQQTLLDNATFTDYAREAERIAKENGASDLELNSLNGGDDGEDN